MPIPDSLQQTEKETDLLIDSSDQMLQLERNVFMMSNAYNELKVQDVQTLNNIEDLSNLRNHLNQSINCIQIQ